MATFVNAAPMVNSLGIQDKSTRTLAIEPEVLPTHLPKVYIYAQKGPTTPQLVVGNSRNSMYGADSFDLRKKYATHTTVLSNLLNAEGNAQMIERIVPANGMLKGNFLLSLDVLEKKIISYERDQDGQYVLDADTGEPVPKDPDTYDITGYQCKWVLTHITSKTSLQTDSDLFGVATVQDGDQVDKLIKSKRYPILQFWAGLGEYYNNTGLRIWAPGLNSNFNSTLFAQGVFPFRMAAIRRDNDKSTAKTVETLSGDPYFDFVFKPGFINSSTDQQMYLGDQYLSKYQSTQDKRFPPQYADIPNFFIYQANVEKLLSDFIKKERDFFGDHAGSDFENTLFTQSDAGAESLKYMYNFFTFANSNGSPYETVNVNNTDSNAFRLSEGANIFCKGGSDGTMDIDTFNNTVSFKVSEYANINSPLQNKVDYPESIIYDSGFPLDVKYKLLDFISVRKDTAVGLSTFVSGGPPLNASEDHSVAVALRTRAMMFPESDYYGTPVTRAFIFGRSGILRNSQYTKRLPIILEVAVKAAKFMGASNGKWKPEYLFDKAPNNEITLFDDVSAVFTPAMQRNKDWDVGLNYASSFSRSSLYIPAIKTVYTDDTSVLNSFFTMMACVELNKIGERVHKEFVGAISLTDAQLIEKVNASVDAKVKDKFAGLFQIVPAAYISDSDAAAGYRWTLPIKIYANNMKTAMTLSIEAYRKSDFTTTA